MSTWAQAKGTQEVGQTGQPNMQASWPSVAIVWKATWKAEKFLAYRWCCSRCEQQKYFMSHCHSYPKDTEASSKEEANCRVLLQIQGLHSAGEVWQAFNCQVAAIVNASRLTVEPAMMEAQQQMNTNISLKKYLQVLLHQAALRSMGSYNLSISNPWKKRHDGLDLIVTAIPIAGQ